VRIEKGRSRNGHPKSNRAETPSIPDYFAGLPDTRRDNENKRHKLIDIIAISVEQFCYPELNVYTGALSAFSRLVLEIKSLSRFGIVAATSPSQMIACKGGVPGIG